MKSGTHRESTKQAATRRVRRKPVNSTSPARLSMPEIERRCWNEWVLLVNPTFDKRLEVLDAELAFHHKSKVAVYDEALRRMDRSTAIFFVGNPEDDPIRYLL